MYQGGTNSFENRDQTVLLTKLSQVKIFSGRELLQLAHTIMHVAPLGRRIHDTEVFPQVLSASQSWVGWGISARAHVHPHLRISGSEWPIVLKFYVWLETQ